MKVPNSGRTEDLLPLKPLSFEILLLLNAGQKHGYALIKELEQRQRRRLFPAQLYRTLQNMMELGLVRPATRGRADVADRRRTFRITAFGRRVAAAEAARLERLLVDARSQRLVPARRLS